MANERLDPLAQHRAVMRQLLVDTGPQAIIDYIQGFDSDPLRRVLYIASKEALAPQEAAGKDLDALIAVSDAGVAEIRGQVKAAEADEERAQMLHGAHIVSYNLAAELADCWPDDDMPRTEAHHRRGVRAADDCLQISEAGGRPGPIANDYWARGIHLLPLGDVEGTIQSWTKAREHAVSAAEANGKPASPGPDGTFLVNLTSGYLGLARWIAGEEEGRLAYELAIAAFRAQADDSDTKEDAVLGLGQLEKTRRQHGPDGAS